MRDVDLGRIKATQTIGKLKYLEDSGKQSEVILTLPLKSLLPLASVRSKTTLNTGGVGGAGADPQT